MEKWYQGIYRRQLVDMHVNDDDPLYLSGFRAEDYFRALKKAEIRSPMIYLQSHTGLCNYPTKVAKTHAAMTGTNNGIRRLISLCLEDGMKVVGYYSLIFNNFAADTHPDWEMKDADGKTWRDHGERYGLCCPNNGEYRLFLTENLRELAGYFPRTHGMFYDMPYWEITCHCDACRKRFREETGRELPEKEDWQDPAWLLFVRKRQDWMGEFARFVRRLSLTLMPESTVELNFSAAIGCEWLGGSTEDINAACEFTGGDLYGDLYNHSFSAKYYYGVTRNQPFEYMTCRCNASLREHTVTKPQEVLDREILLTCAHHGASMIIDAINPDGTLDERVYEKMGNAFRKQIPYENYMDRGTLYADVAVYFDSRTQFRDRECATFNKLCAINAHRTLVENHIPVAIVANGNMDRLQDYRMIVAPCLQDFENDEPMKFIEYVENGGVLYLSGKSDKRLIEKFFGAEFIGYTNGASETENRFRGKRVQAYVRPTDDYVPLMAEFNDKYPLPFTYKLPLFRKGKGNVKARVTLPYTVPDDRRKYASIHSNPPGIPTDFPAVTEISYGKGKVVWTTALLEEDERKNYKDIFANVVRRFVTPKYDISASRRVECVIFEETERVFLSFVDLDGSDECVRRVFSVKFPRQYKSVKNLTTGAVSYGPSDAYSDGFTEFCMLEAIF